MYEQFFPHDYNARSDEKLLDVTDKYGLAGYGVYWVIVEMIHEYGGDMKQERLKQISSTYHVKRSMVEDIAYNFGLFQTSDGKITSKRIKHNFEVRKEKALKAEELKKRMQDLANQRWGNVPHSAT